MAGGDISRAGNSKNSKKKFKAREKKRLAEEARQKAEEESARQNEHLIEYLKWYIPYSARLHCQCVKAFTKSVNEDDSENFQKLAKSFLNGEITERSVILEMAPKYAAEYGVLFDFEDYDPNSPYPSPTNNPYYYATDAGTDPAI